MDPSKMYQVISYPSVSYCNNKQMASSNIKLAIAYVPYQLVYKLFCPIEALKHGTIFPELCKPYEVNKNNIESAYKSKRRYYDGQI